MGPRWVQDGSKMGSKMKSEVESLPKSDFGRFWRFWAGHLGDIIFSRIFGRLKNRKKLLGKNSEGQFWEVLEVQNRCQHRPCQTCENGVFASAKRKILTSGVGPEATKKFFGRARSRLQKKKSQKWPQDEILKKMKISIQVKMCVKNVCQKKIQKYEKTYVYFWPKLP